MSQIKKTKKERLYCDPRFKRMFMAEAAMRGFSSPAEFSSHLGNEMEKGETTIKDLFTRKKKDGLFKL